MTKLTTKYVRGKNQWVKIDRNNELKTFSFYRGHNNNFSSHSSEIWSFKSVSNWTEALSKANQMIADYA